MADETDRAQDADANNLADALQAQRLRAGLQRRPAARGECLNPKCGEPFSETNRLFCNSACEGIYTRLKR